jgi:hypothetical protein
MWKHIQHMFMYHTYNPCYNIEWKTYVLISLKIDICQNAKTVFVLIVNSVKSYELYLPTNVEYQYQDKYLNSLYIGISLLKCYTHLLFYTYL